MDQYPTSTETPSGQASDQTSGQIPNQNMGDQRPLSMLALWSMILGIVFFFFGPLALIPLIMGIIGIITTSSEKPKKGMGFAIAGTVLGAFGTLASCLLLGILLPALGQARMKAQELVSATNVRSQLQAAVIYAADNDDLFPPVNQWPDVAIDLGLLEPEQLISPREDGDGISYIYLGGWNSFDAQEIVIYEDPKHFEDFVIVGFADAHVDLIPHAEFNAMLQEQQQSQP